MDLDQEAMEQQLSLANEDSYASARRIYEEGAFSKSVATVTLVTGLPRDVPKNTPIMGIGSDGNQIAGVAYADNAAGQTSFIVRYRTSDSQRNYVNCQVGASVNPNLEGCFAASGTFTIDGGSTVDYSYNPLMDNTAKRTLQGFSTEAQKKMMECPNCPYETFEAFYEYFGMADYGNEMVIAAFEGRATNFRNFNNDFKLYGYDGKDQIIKKTTAYLIVWMYVIREMEDALDDCKEQCTIENCNDDPVHAWDEAVAFYTGSLEGPDGSGSGKFPYALADKRCGNFKTCGDMADSTTGGSKVNMEIFRNFNIGLAKLAKGECTSARTNKDIIEKLIRIPLIQGTLRYAWKTDTEPFSEKAEAEGVIFALGIIPLVHQCNPDAAAVIADNMVAGQSGKCDFSAVKAAFESTYDCMGVDGALVGGYWDAAMGNYFEGAEPMVSKGKAKVVSAGSMTSFAAAAGVAAATAITMFL